MGVWDRIPVQGTWRDGSNALRKGQWMVRVFHRTTNVAVSILPAGLIGSGALSITEPGPSLSIGIPASDDPATGVDDLEVEIQVDTVDGANEIYRIQAPMILLPGGINLADVIPTIGQTDPPAPAPILIKNIPNGIAGLDSTGRVPLTNMPIVVDPVSTVGLPDGTLIARTS